MLKTYFNCLIQITDLVFAKTIKSPLKQNWKKKEKKS